MPLKLCKPRTIRALVLVLIFLTLLFALYQVLYGSASQIVPSIFVPYQANNEDVDQHKIDTGDSAKVVEDVAKNKWDDNWIPIKNSLNNSSFSSGLIPHYHEGFSAAKYDIDRQPGRCPKIQIFKPDLDISEIYPTLDFNGKWTLTKEYWNTEFEQRYRTIKNSTKTPRLRVFVVPHSHNDPGWLKTFEQYYASQTRKIIDNAVEKLAEFKSMTFQWSEISFLSKWWKDAHPWKRNLLKTLVNEGRFEIVTGGWVMTDEATVNLYSMIDQLIEGQQWTKSHLNVTAKSSWSVDPFGHGSTLPYILKLSGINAMIIQRIHYGWKKFFMVNRNSDFEWVQRWDLSKKSGIHCHNQPFDIYSIKHSCGPHPMLCLNFDFRSIAGEYSENTHIMHPITDENVKAKAELMLEQYGKTGSLFPHNMALIPMGDDFRFQHEVEWGQQYSNYMRLFDYINSHKEQYNAEIRFATISEYFKAVEDEASYQYPSLSGDFHVYSDIFSDGHPAYWSGYYSTRPYWKKFYREVENVVRGAEILYTFANVLVNQRKLNNSKPVMTQLYEELTTSRRWLALFAHHDACTGTSKAQTMNDYGDKLFEAYQLGTKIQTSAIETILFGNPAEGRLSTETTIDGFGEEARQIPVALDDPSVIRRVVLYNSLARHRYHNVRIVVSTPHIEVIGPGGEFIQAQLNPVVDTSNQTQLQISSEVFELTFLAYLAPLSVSIYQLKRATPDGEHNAVRAAIYCKACKSMGNIFEISEMEKGDIQLNNDRMQVLFDRNTGMLKGISKTNEKISTTIDMKFGSYGSVFFKSGAYLLKPDTNKEDAVPYPDLKPKMVIISGPVLSEVTVMHPPLTLSSKIMHVGDTRMLEALYVLNIVDVGKQSGEVFMRMDTDLRSVSKSHSSEKQNNVSPDDIENQVEDDNQPTFYTDQAGYTVEKRVKIPTTGYEGNTYPVNTMVYLQDHARKLRFSILVDRSHGFSSMEVGRLEALVERRTTYDDGRGMGEGVVDNRPTTSNYIILFEKLGPNDKVRHYEGDYRTSQPTLAAHHHSQELSYPAFTYLLNDSTGANLEATKPSNGNENQEIQIFPLLTQELPCDINLLNLRTLTDSSVDPEMTFPSNKALMIVQRLGYLCTSGDDKPGCGNPNPASLFYPDTKFNGLRVQSIVPSNLVGEETEYNENKGEKSISSLHNMDPFEIKSVVVTFNQ